MVTLRTELTAIRAPTFTTVRAEDVNADCVNCDHGSKQRGATRWTHEDHVAHITRATEAIARILEVGQRCDDRLQALMLIAPRCPRRAQRPPLSTRPRPPVRV